MGKDNDISSIDFNVSIEERIKRLKSVYTCDNCPHAGNLMCCHNCPNF